MQIKDFLLLNQEDVSDEDHINNMIINFSIWEGELAIV